MNKTQRLILIIGAIAVLAVTLFPPWTYRLHIGEVNKRIAGEHAFVFSPPSQKDAAADFDLAGTTLDASATPFTSVCIDGPRLAGELAGVVLATAGLVLAFWRRPEEKTRTSP